MDRRAKKLEKKRKQRAVVKKQKSALAARVPGNQQSLVRAGARASFGPCWVSVGWDELEVPALVHVLVTRELVDGTLLPGIALVDRTCLGVKDGFVAKPMSRSEASGFAAQVGLAHGGMIPCEPLIAQSVVFHAIDYARKLGFEPHPDFPEPLFGPRPDQLEATPWSDVEKPLFVPGPYDEVREILTRLSEAKGAGNFELIDGVDAHALEGDEVADNDDGLIYLDGSEQIVIPADLHSSAK